MKTELKKILVQFALNFVLWICPNGNFKIQYCKFLIDNLKKL